jgi:short subunit dehydrogenase-like uncharacterized protein
MARRYDVVVWGATGFTGRLVVEYFVTTVTKREPSVRWAIAGRNSKKLQDLKAELFALTGDTAARDVDVLIGDSSLQSTVDAIVRQTHVMCCTAGPFTKYGTPVVDACVRFGTHYTDINGESPWVYSLIQKYHRTAKDSGVRIVPNCGFDCIPSDLGTLYAISLLQKKKGPDAKVRRVTAYFALKGGFSGGTLATGMLMDGTPELAKLQANPFLLGGGPGYIREEDEDITTKEFVKELGCWTGPFAMAVINTRVVRRSAALFEEAGRGWGRNFGYNEKLIVPNEKMADKLAKGSAPVAVREKLVKAGRLPKPGQGPSREQRTKNWFRVIVVAESEDGDFAAGEIKGGDAGYTETAKMVAESALSLLDGGALSCGQGGILTSAFALGHGVIARLNNAGISFKPKRFPPAAKL